MNVTRGDIVVVDFPHASQPTATIRPAVIVQCDHNNQLIANIIVAQITSKIRHLHARTRVLIDPSTPEGASSGLLMISVVTCENLLTVRRDAIHRILGHLSPTLMQQVNDALKAALEIP